MGRRKSQWCAALPQNQEVGLGERGEGSVLPLDKETGCFKKRAVGLRLQLPGHLRSTCIHSFTSIACVSPLCLLQTSSSVGVGHEREEVAVTGSEDRAQERPVRKLREASLSLTPAEAHK